MGGQSDVATSTGVALSPDEKLALSIDDAELAAMGYQPVLRRGLLLAIFCGSSLTPPVHASSLKGFNCVMSVAFCFTGALQLCFRSARLALNMTRSQQLCPSFRPLRSSSEAPSCPRAARML